MKVICSVSLISIALFLIAGYNYAQSSERDVYKDGINYALKGEFKKAKKEFEDALKIDSLYTSAQHALQTIDDILSKKIKKETGIYIFKGVQYDDSGNYEQAVSEYSKAIEINPQYSDGYNKRGLSRFNQKKYELAIDDYNMAVKINPLYTEAYNNRGIVYYEQEHFDLAIRDYTKAIETDPKYAKAYHNRGLVYFLKLKDTDKGCADWQKACELGECSNYKMAKEKKLCK